MRYKDNKIFSIKSHTYIKAPSLSISEWPAKHRAYIEARMATVCENSNPKEKGSDISCSLKPEQRVAAVVHKQKAGKQSCMYKLFSGQADRPNENIYRLTEILEFR